MSKLALVTCPICSEHVPESLINQHIDQGCSSASISKWGTKLTQENLTPFFGSQRNKPQTPKNKRALAQDVSSPISTPAKRSKKMEHLHRAMPLAERLRPKLLKEFVGQEHLLGRDSFLIGSNASMIFWGPPGCGKTTLARLFATESDAIFRELSATGAGINEVRVEAEEAKRQLALTGRRTILFLDEVHRFNKAQQDVFLPYVEQGQLQLIGATTENPSFRLTSALLSRCRVLVLEKISDENMKTILLNAVNRVIEAEGQATLVEPEKETVKFLSQSTDSGYSSQTAVVVPEATQHHPQLTQKVLSAIVSLAAGDARSAITFLDLVLSSPKDRSEAGLLTALRQSASVAYDRTGESHYDMISALHKSVRGSQPHAALYWLARMLAGGEDPLYIARRMVVCASEDIGLADNHALPLAMAAFQACQVIGMPECRINLAHIVSYLAEAPKCTRAYEGLKNAEAAVKLDPTLPVPMVMRNAPTKLMKEIGYGANYNYNPEFAHPVHNEYLPTMLRGETFLREAGDKSGKVWDEEALCIWEREENGGRKWEGRSGMKKLSGDIK